MTYTVPLLLIGVLFIGGCATPVPPSEPAAMIPAKLNAILPAGISLYIERVHLESAAAECKAPFDELTGKFPFVQPQGLANYQESIRLTLASVGAKLSATPESASYVLRTSILGGIAIPFPEAYSILFVHYQLEDSLTGKIVWMKNVYSQAKLENLAATVNSKTPDAAYARLAAANLRQMATALEVWFASDRNEANKRGGT